MAIFRVDRLDFSFRTNFQAVKYDDWAHHRNVLMDAGKKAMDLVAFRMTSPPPHCWLVEAKDFRVIRGTPGDKNLLDLPKVVASKVIDTWGGLGDAASNASIGDEKRFATLARSASAVRVVLHMEPYKGESKLFPKAPNPANVQQKLKQLIGHLDRKPLVLSIATTSKSDVPWTVTGI